MPDRETRSDPPAFERRVIDTPEALRTEVRAAGGRESRRVVGHASVHERWTTLHDGEHYTLREIVRPGAFAEAIRQGQETFALWNHNADIPLARTGNGTLVLSEDEIGLLSDFEPPDTQWHRDTVLTPIENGLVRKMSFAFSVRKSGEVKRSRADDGAEVMENGGERVTTRREGNRVIEERELLSLNTFDVSPVVFPAYTETDVAVRSRCERREQEIRDRVIAESKKRKSDRLALMRMGLTLADARYRGGVS